MRITSSSDRLRILLLGACPAGERLVSEALLEGMASGYSLCVAPRLDDALAACASQQFDIALLDSDPADPEVAKAAPGPLAVMETLRRHAPDLPVVLLTSQREERIARNALARNTLARNTLARNALARNALGAGAEDYLCKAGMDGHLLKRSMQYAILRRQFEGVLILRGNRDPLTGLADRILFKSRLDMARARLRRGGGRAFAVLHLDLDGFHAVNEALGKAGADTILRQVAERLKSAFRAQDTLARFEGDDFMLLAENLAAARDSREVAAKIIALLAAPFRAGGRAFTLTMSIGVAVCAPGEDLTASELLHQAEAAMHDAKLVAGNSCRHFRDLLDRLASDSLLEEEV